MTRLVLVVEDELLIRMVAVETLADYGFATREADSTREALDILLPDIKDFAAVIIDIGLPDRPGDELAAELRQKSADLPIIITTGHDHSRIPRRLLDDPQVRVVSKPYDYEALNAALGQLGVTGSHGAASCGPSPS
jgi:CheY-like chemotaxis protein